MTEEIKENEILVAEDGSIIESKAAEAVPPTEDNDEDDERTVKAEEETHEDELGEEGESAEDAEARRERNRQRRKENKQRRSEYIDSLKREIAARDEILQQAMQRLDAVERRTQGADMAAVGAELQKSVDAYNYFKAQHAEAVSAANGQLAAEAVEKMNAAAERARQLDSIRKAAQKQTSQPAPQPLDPRLKVQAEQWLERNKWYDPDGKDMDSRIALTIDQELHREGWNPTTEQYWAELDARVKKYLPHRAGSGYNKTNVGNKTSARAPVGGSGRETSASGTGGYVLSADRVQALKDAGMWDDPVKRAAMIKRYQQQDKEQANG